MIEVDVPEIDVPAVDVEAFHADRAGITEDLLHPARDGSGRNPYRWLAEALPPTGTVIDLACGSARLADDVGVDRYLGLDRSAAELAQARRRRPAATVVRADATAAPVRGPVAAVAASMALMLLDLDAVLAEAARLLPVGGVLAATLPLRDVPAGRPYGALLAAMGLAGVPYPTPLGPARLRSAAAAAGFTITSDDVVEFARPLRDRADVELVVSSFYGRPTVDRSAAARAVLTSVGPSLPYPVRRVVAVRQVGAVP